VVANRPESRSINHNEFEGGDDTCERKPHDTLDDYEENFHGY
jgi:hypothetical protein